MEYKDMTKEELITYIEECRKKRAFTYEDQMKLAFIDTSPFTLWASDRECKVKLWEGQCEALYGYTSNEVLEKDYVELFVAPDEQKAAREDQLSIIDNGAKFHNIANDVGKNGNTLRLITNCWRIRDPISGEYWNAEMGLIIDFYEQEKVRLEQIISESKLFKTRVSQFIECADQYKEQFLKRQVSINTAIRNCERKAINLKKRREFINRIEPIKDTLNDIESILSHLSEDYYSKIQVCGSSSACWSLTQVFKEEYERTLSRLEDVITDFEEINVDYNDSDGMVVGKDSVMKESSQHCQMVMTLACELQMEIDRETEEYKSLGAVRDNSIKLKFFRELRDDVEEIKDKTNMVINEVYIKIDSVESSTELINLRNYMKEIYQELENKLCKIQKRLRRLK